MKHSLSRLSAAAISVSATSALACLEPSAPAVPGQLVPPVGNKVFLVAHAVGFRTYRCDPTSGQWTLVAPLADLYGDDGTLIGTHFSGPAWEARDGSYVTAARVAGTNADPTALDWLLLRTRASGSGYEGDRLAGTTYVQRVATTGGRAPIASEHDVLGDMVEIPYTADYYFWKKVAA
jgi:hypothetical protein